MQGDKMRQVCGVAVLLAATSICAKAQEEKSGPCWPQRGDPTTEAPAALDHALKDAGYTAARTSLLSALRDSKSPVRSVAAARLATVEGPSAIPDLLAAWAEEKDRCAKEGMALALASLGKPVYVRTLARRGGQNLARPFQACAPSKSPMLSLHIEAVPQSPVTRPLIRIVLRNITRQPLALLRMELPGATFSVTVLDPAGNHAAIAEGKQSTYRSDVASLLLAYDPPRLAPVMPNEEISATWKVADDFNMSAPGTYRVSLGGRIDYLNTTVCSNVLRVEVK